MEPAEYEMMWVRGWGWVAESASWKEGVADN